MSSEKKEVRTSGQVDRKYDELRKSYQKKPKHGNGYDYYFTDSDNDGLADVHDVDDLNPDIQDYSQAKPLKFEDSKVRRTTAQNRHIPKSSKKKTVRQQKQKQKKFKVEKDSREKGDHNDSSHEHSNHKHDSVVPSGDNVNSNKRIHTKVDYEKSSPVSPNRQQRNGLNEDKLSPNKQKVTTLKEKKVSQQKHEQAVSKDEKFDSNGQRKNVLKNDKVGQGKDKQASSEKKKVSQDKQTKKGSKSKSGAKDKNGNQDKRQKATSKRKQRLKFHDCLC